jgi:hypothetical protein
MYGVEYFQAGTILSDPWIKNKPIWVRENCFLNTEKFTHDINVFSVLKNTVLWDVTAGSPVEVSRRFGGTYGLHLQTLSVNQARN